MEAVARAPRGHRVPANPLMSSNGNRSMTQPNDPQRQFELAAQQARERGPREKQAQEKARREPIAKAKAEEARQQARLETFRTLFRRYQQELVRPMLIAFANAQKLRFTGPEV